MTRKYSDTLKAEIATNLPDNVIQAITAADVRQALLDIVDSLRPSWAGLAAAHTEAPVTLALTTTWQTIAPAGFWTSAAQSDVAELQALQATGQLDIKFGDWNHIVRGAINFEAPNGQEVQISIGVDGAVAGTISSVDGGGTGRVVAAADWVIVFPPIGTKLSLMARVPAGTASIQIHQAQLFGELTTTRYP